MNKFTKFIIWIMLLSLVFVLYPTIANSMTTATQVYGTGNILVPLLPIILVFITLGFGIWWVFKSE